MRVQIWPEQNESTEKVENGVFAEEFTTEPGLDQHAVEFIQPPLGHHVHMSGDPMAC